MDKTTIDLVLLVVAGAATALACGLGAVPVFFLRERARAWRPMLQGLAIGLMTVASVEGLFRPALRSGGVRQAGLGFLLGVLFVLALRRAMRGSEPQIGTLRGAGVRRSVLVFAVLFLHSFPEGMAMGAAQASEIAGLNVFVVAAIALQNVPEGTAVALPMAATGFGRTAQFTAALLSSLPQPIAAPLAYLIVERVSPLLPISLAFAGGAMLAVVVLELVPEAFTRRRWRSGAAGTLAGSLMMALLSAVLGV